MKRVVWFFFFAVVCTPIVVNAGSNEVTGNKLPDLVKVAIKYANKATFKWQNGQQVIEDRTSIRDDQVVLIKDMAIFCSEKNILPTSCQKIGLAFTLNKSYPLYINADQNTPSIYKTVESLFLSSMPDIAYLVSAILVHEDWHGRGNSDETASYSREFGFISHLKTEGKLNNSPWLSGYFKDLNDNLAAYKGKDGTITLTISKSQATGNQ